MKRFTLFVALLLSLVAITTSAQNSGFSYQAVVRNTKGEAVANSKVLMRMSLSVDETVYYQEVVETTTNAYGNVSIIVGEGKNVIKGSFDAVPWESMAVMMKTEIDVTSKGDKYIDFGSVQINPVPYAYYAAKTSNVITATSNNSEPIFCVKDKDGNIVFAVYNDSVVTYINTNNDGSKAAKSAFAVRGRSGAKGEMVDYLNIDNNGTTIYVDDEDNSKAAKSAFAVRGRSGAKDEANYLSVNSDGTTVFIDTDDSKAAKSAFAVRGRSGAKDDNSSNYFNIGNEGTTVYIDGGDGDKAAKSAFAVRGRSGAKGEEETQYMTISTDSTRFYVKDNNGEANGFAVVGQNTQEQLFAVDKKNVTINSSMYVNGSLHTSTGSVNKIGEEGTKYFYAEYYVVTYNLETQEQESHTLKYAYAYFKEDYYEEGNKIKEVALYDSYDPFIEKNWEPFLMKVYLEEEGNLTQGNTENGITRYGRYNKKIENYYEGFSITSNSIIISDKLLNDMEGVENSEQYYSSLLFAQTELYSYLRSVSETIIIISINAKRVILGLTGEEKVDDEMSIIDFTNEY